MYRVPFKTNHFEVSRSNLPKKEALRQEVKKKVVGFRISTIE